MDAIHYDKIADKLINFHSKLPQLINLQSEYAVSLNRNAKERIEGLLKIIDELAKADAQGWIR
tara:strand:+ start:1236 stop:1424 length:189 start_codon:yes stop_codon:yes gene_type:complete